MSNLEIHESTYRQRKHLLAVTIILIMIHHGGVSFGSDLRLFGTSVHIEKPDIIFTFLRLAQAYFVLRFYQYFHTDKAFGELINQYRHTRNRRFDILLIDYIKAQIPSGRKLKGHYSYNQLLANRPENGFYTITVEYPCSKGVVNQSKCIDIPVKLFSLNRKIRLTTGFIFRARILTDFFLPFGLVMYSFVIPLFSYFQ